MRISGTPRSIATRCRATVWPGLTPCVPVAEAFEFHVARSVPQRLCLPIFFPMIAQCSHNSCNVLPLSCMWFCVGGFSGGYHGEEAPVDGMVEMTPLGNAWMLADPRILRCWLNASTLPDIFFLSAEVLLSANRLFHLGFIVLLFFQLFQLAKQPSTTQHLRTSVTDRSYARTNSLSYCLCDPAHLCSSLASKRSESL
jgi:hypothetical protein